MVIANQWKSLICLPRDFRNQTIMTVQCLARCTLMRLLVPPLIMAETEKVTFQLCDDFSKSKTSRYKTSVCVYEPGFKSQCCHTCNHFPTPLGFRRHAALTHDINPFISPFNSCLPLNGPISHQLAFRTFPLRLCLIFIRGDVSM